MVWWLTLVLTNNSFFKPFFGFPSAPWSNLIFRCSHTKNPTIPCWIPHESHRGFQWVPGPCRTLQDPGDPGDPGLASLACRLASPQVEFQVAGVLRSQDRHVCFKVVREMGSEAAEMVGNREPLGTGKRKRWRSDFFFPWRMGIALEDDLQSGWRILNGWKGKVNLGNHKGKKTNERFRWVLEGEMARLRLGFPVDVSTYDI